MTDESKTGTLIDQMFSVGAHFGYTKMRRHPSARPFIFGAKNKVEIIDLGKTNEMLLEAKKFVKELASNGGTLLFVGGKNEAQNIVHEAAESINMPYVAGRWIGGTITNFSEIKKRIARLEELRDQRDKGTLAEKYTKKEQLLISREITKLESFYGGMLGMKDTLPKVLFIIDTKHEDTAVREARVKKIPIVGLLNSDCDLDLIDYPIIANDATAASIAFFVNEIVASYKEGLASPKVEDVTKK